MSKRTSPEVWLGTDDRFQMPCFIYLPLPHACHEESLHEIHPKISPFVKYHLVKLLSNSIITHFFFLVVRIMYYYSLIPICTIPPGTTFLRIRCNPWLRLIVAYTCLIILAMTFDMRRWQNTSVYYACQKWSDVCDRQVSHRDKRGQCMLVIVTPITSQTPST